MLHVVLLRRPVRYSLGLDKTTVTVMMNTHDSLEKDIPNTPKQLIFGQVYWEMHLLVPYLLKEI